MKMETNRRFRWIMACVMVFAPGISLADLFQPESIEYDPAGDRYFVSNYGDGSLVEIDSDGQQRYYATGLGRCVGLHIVNGVLYVNRAEHGMRGYDLSTGAVVVDLTIPGMQFLNDITSDGSAYLYLTDWFPGGTRIYKVRMADYDVSTFLSGGFSYTNGILYDEYHNRLLTVGYVGTNYTVDYLISISLDDSTDTATYNPGVNGFDGLTMDNEGSIYFSAWPTDAVYRYAGGLLEGSPELVASGLRDPADIFFNTYDNILAVPNFGNNTVEFIPLQFSKVTAGPAVNDGGSTQGVSWADYDNDGYPDLLVTNLLYPQEEDNRLYHNEGDGTFLRVESGSIVQDGGYSRTSTWGDYDNDGDMDAFIANWPDQVNFLYRNNGDGTFSRAAEGELTAEVRGSPSAGWTDYDNDGDLDILIANYGPNSLFRNEGGSFIKIHEGEIVQDDFDSYGVAWADYDNDGDQDLFVANPGGEGQDWDNRLFENHGDGTFTRILEGPIVTDGGESFGGSWGDYDNDGDLDLFVTNVNYSSDGNDFLYRNNADGSFDRVSEGDIVTGGGYSFGSAWGDYDNDGFLDLFVANCPSAQGSRDFLYHNNGDGTFGRETGGAIALDEGASYGAAWADYDRDGDLDLFVARMGNSNENNALFRNNGSRNTWLTVTAVGIASNAAAIGAQVRVCAAVSGRSTWQLREISSQTGYCGQNSLSAHFGLGQASAVDTVRIQWPGGGTELWIDVAANQHVVLHEGSGIVVASRPGEAGSNGGALRLLGVYPNPGKIPFTVRFALTETDGLDVEVYDIGGRLVQRLVRGRQYPAGTHTVTWDGSCLGDAMVAPAPYLLRVAAGTTSAWRKMLVIR